MCALDIGLSSGGAENVLCAVSSAASLAFRERRAGMPTGRETLSHTGEGKSPSGCRYPTWAASGNSDTVGLSTLSMVEMAGAPVSPLMSAPRLLDFLRSRAMLDDDLCAGPCNGSPYRSGKASLPYRVRCKANPSFLAPGEHG